MPLTSCLKKKKNIYSFSFITFKVSLRMPDCWNVSYVDSYSVLKYVYLAYKSNIYKSNV